MTRPLRLEFAGALYHITSRGDRLEDIYLNNEDRCDWLDVLGNRAGVRSNIPTFLNILQHFVGETGIKWNPAGLGSI